MSRPNVADWQYLGVDKITRRLEWNSGRKPRKGHICEDSLAYASYSSKVCTHCDSFPVTTIKQPWKWKLHNRNVNHCRRLVGPTGSMFIELCTNACARVLPYDHDNRLRYREQMLVWDKNKTPFNISAQVTPLEGGRFPSQTGLS